MSTSLPITDSPLGLIDALIAEQQSLTAVERFSAEHDTALEEPAQARYYRDLMPASAPEPGQQYGFEVDLDACSGCKACVVACHTMNGLQDAETWRQVGLLSGGSDSRVQHVTTACHHCVEPGCLSGCPVQAYDKDPDTGIVRHLDDQCIGCKYCTMMCPYEVPQYSESLGIVRKCDMCHQRLGVGEAPACVQSCPNAAISIALVDVAEAQQWAGEPGAKLVPQSPQSSLTIPTTRYIGAAKENTSLAAQDQSIDDVSDSHWPLAVMLVLTQISVGMLIAERLAVFMSGLWGAAVPAEAGGDEVVRWTLTASLLIGGVGLNLAALHLGQPLKAWRVFLGLRTSWLSREAIVLGKFIGLLAAATALAWLPVLSDELPDPLNLSVPHWLLPAVYGGAIGVGILGLYCSGMIYIVTRRQLWRPARTLPRFYGTAVAGGLTLLLPILAWFGVDTGTFLLIGTLAVMAVGGKACWELRIHLGKKPHEDTNDERSRRLAVGALARLTSFRLAAATICASSILLATVAGLADWNMPAVALGIVAGASLICGEIAERLLYFSTVVYDRMPRIVS